MATPLKTVLVIGGGGREHTLLKACVASPLVERVIAAPGNGGMADDAECYNVSAEDIPGLVKLAQEQNVDFAIVGPEAPLAEGAVDEFAKVGIPAYGPNKAGAQLEASKVFTKNFLFKYNIPTAGSETFSDTAAATEYLKQKNTYPIVIKASGLAAGKGVIIAQSEAEAIAAVEDMLDKKVFGESGAELLVEDYMDGEEASIMVMCCGEKYVILPASQDHKRIGEGDTGLNTGGMGAYAPAPVVTPTVYKMVVEKIVEPTLKGLVAEGIDYRGTLYVGIMITSEGPKVVEFNVRFGDPEVQVLLPLLETDPVELMHACATGTLDPESVKVSDGHAMIVVQAAGGYPGSYDKGEVISFPAEQPSNAHVIHAGTKKLENGDIVTSGGRVLGIVGKGDSLREAADAAYNLCDQVSFKDVYFRRDIGHREFNRKSY